MNSYKPECRICQLDFVPDSPEDQYRHGLEHSRYAGGLLPPPVREFMKSWGWAVAHNDGGIARSVNMLMEDDQEAAKLVIAYSWWSRARWNGVPSTDFDEYMIAHLEFIDSDIAKDEMRRDQASAVIKRWEQFAG